MGRDLVEETQRSNMTVHARIQPVGFVFNAAVHLAVFFIDISLQGGGLIRDQLAQLCCNFIVVLAGLLS